MIDLHGWMGSYVPMSWLCHCVGVAGCDNGNEIHVRDETVLFSMVNQPNNQTKVTIQTVMPDASIDVI